MTAPRVRTITLEPDFTNRRSSEPNPEPITGLFYGKTEAWWFVHIDGHTEAYPRADWREITGVTTPKDPQLNPLG